MVTPPRKVFHVLINFNIWHLVLFFCFNKKFREKNRVQLKLSKFRCVVLLLRKAGRLELLPSIQIQLRAVSFLFLQLPEEMKFLKLAKNVQDD